MTIDSCCFGGSAMLQDIDQICRGVVTHTVITSTTIAQFFAMSLAEYIVHFDAIHILK